MLPDSHLDASRDELAADLAAIDLSFGCLADVEFDLPQRSPDSRAEHLRQTWSAGLTAPFELDGGVAPAR